MHFTVDVLSRFLFYIARLREPAWEMLCTDMVDVGNASTQRFWPRFRTFRKLLRYMLGEREDHLFVQPDEVVDMGHQ